MKCVICGIESDSIEDAIEEGWIPSFYEAKTPHGPACPSCSEALLERDSAGEMGLKELFRGKITYQETFRHEISIESIIVGISIQNSLQSILN